MMIITLETIQEKASIQEAAKKMKEKDVRSLVVVDNNNQNKPQGIVTERDIVRKACINDTRTSEVPLRVSCLLLLLQLTQQHLHRKQLI
jgi:CBS domain-containing protein